MENSQTQLYPDADGSSITRVDSTWLDSQDNSTVFLYVIIWKTEYTNFKQAGKRETFYTGLWESPRNASTTQPSDSDTLGVLFPHWSGLPQKDFLPCMVMHLSGWEAELGVQICTWHNCANVFSKHYNSSSKP